ncbi:Tic20 family protein [Synechococcus sp. PCC 7336]|uniref:Tic20 family protein n=1 Tax=Synechococcus sp. PCC 7336 TaxID=195250 RepID=UPI00034542E7|nr:Tic20 family protein [Synechococcus sp. PCC 7336]
MVVNRATSAKDRVLAGLPYLLPMLLAFRFGIALYLAAIEWFPDAYRGSVAIAISRLIGLSGSFWPSIGLFAIFFFVVRNRRYAYFLRFNAAQALAIGIGIHLLLAVLSLLNIVVTSSGNSAIFMAIYLATYGLCLVSLFQVARGRLPEFNYVSDAAKALSA